MFYCRVCGQPTTNDSWPWEVCLKCEPFQQAVSTLAERYQDEIPAEALKALDASLHVYSDRSGERVIDQKARHLRIVLDHSREHAFYDAFTLPGLKYAHAASIARFCLDLVLDSGFLPELLSDEIRTYLAEADRRQKRLDKIITFSSGECWFAGLAETKPGTDGYQEVTGVTEAEAVANLVAAFPLLQMGSTETGSCE